MNILHRIVWQGLRKNRARTLVTIVGVALSAALFTGVASFAVSLQSYLLNGAVEKYGGWQIELPAADAATAAAAAADERVAEVVSLQNIGYAALEDSKNAAKPYLFLSGWDSAAFDSLPLTLLSGRLPENDSELLVPAHLAANGGVKLAVGQTITLQIGQRVREGKLLSQHDPYAADGEWLEPTLKKSYTVVGICQRPAIEEYSAPGYTMITAADGQPVDSQALFVTLRHPYQLAAYKNAVADEGDIVLNDNVLRFIGLSSEKTFTMLLAVLVVALVALVVIGSVFLIYNAFSISLSERTQQFGILMSVGATARQLRHAVLFEGLCIGAVGIPLGILAGLPGVRLLLLLIEKNFANALYADVPLKLVISLPAILAAAVISLATIFLSAYLPARKATAMSVLDCIRQTQEIRLDARAVRSSAAWGIAEQLALKNFKRNRRRYRSVILSLSFSMVLFVGASVFSGYLDQIAQGVSPAVEQYDIVFSSNDIEEAQLLALYDQLKNADDVTVSGYQAEASYPCQIEVGQLSDKFLNMFGKFLEYDASGQQARAVADAVFIDDGAYQQLRERLALPNDGQDGRLLLFAYVEDGWYWQEEPAALAICGSDGQILQQVSAVYVQDHPDLLPAEAGQKFRGYSFLLIAPYEAKAQFDALGAAVRTTLGMTFQSDQPGRSTAQMRDILAANGVTADYSLYNLYAILEQNRNLNFVIQLFAAVFVGMIGLIAVANVFNTISTNIRLRRRELAMLRSVGMAERDFRNMLCFECLLYGGRTLLWGVPLSLALSCLLYEGMLLGGDQQFHSYREKTTRYACGGKESFSVEHTKDLLIK